MRNKTSREKAKLIARFAAEKKGEDIVLMDMANLSMMCDWFVIISAGSPRRVKTVSDTIKKALFKKKLEPLHVEGKSSSCWTLLDYGDVVVHVFYKGIREFYALERLWADAPKQFFNDKCLGRTSRKKYQESF